MTNFVMAINVLLSTLNNDPDWSDMAENVVETLHACAGYVELVTSQEGMIQNARFRMDPPEFRAYVMNLDRTRRIQHEALMTEVNVLNRLCKMVGLPPIAPNVDENRRETYFDFAKQVVDEYFTTGPIGSVSES